jgi:hypothetical protein
MAFSGFLEDDEKINYILSTRSRLYPLEPRGLGSFMKEGLISYITRLSEAHCIEVGTLVSYECSSNFGVPRIYSYHSNKVMSTFYKDATSINGFGSISLEMEKAIKKLTLRSDIEEMNLNKWVFIPRNKSIVKRYKHWCSQCYSEWKEAGVPIYDPLIWSINLLKICPVHKTLLQTSCPKCFREIPIIHHRSMISHCIYCFNSLITNIENQATMSEEEQLFQEWLSESLGSMLVCEKEFVDTTSICNSLKMFREKYCENNDRVFSRVLLIENKRRQLNAYCRGAAAPHFNLLLWFCYILGVKLVDICTGGEFTQNGRDSNDSLHDFKKYFMIENKWSKIDKVLVREKLQKYYTCYPPRSFKSISRELNVEESYLRKSFPKEAKFLSTKFRKFREAQKIENLQMQKNLMEKVIDDFFRENNAVPSKSMLKRLMGSSHVTFKRELMDYYREKIKEYNVITQASD